MKPKKYDPVTDGTRMYRRYWDCRESSQCVICREPVKVNPRTKKPYVCCERHRIAERQRWRHRRNVQAALVASRLLGEPVAVMDPAVGDPYVTFLRQQFQMQIENPARLGIITDIEEP